VLVRKTVTVLFCDLVGSTALGERTDPELLREQMSRYHGELREILERHGGTVEKFVGDAVMAVFGLPQVNEDDALRATRAALAMREAVEAHGWRVRIGINTGEVVAGEGETLVTGDAVNVAARLEQAAEPGEILLGEGTEELIRVAVLAEALEPLELKGKAEPVAAFRLLDLRRAVPAFTRPIATPFIGREHELDVLRGTLRTAVEQRSPQLATIVGPPGIGKSRLARELIQRAEARVLVGRCVSYGEGITYLPLAEIVGQAGDVASIVDDELAVQRVRAVVGAGTATADEIAWGFRRLFETLAQQRSLIVVLDDIHWAEPKLLDLIEYVAAFAEGVPMLLLCMARPDLFERRAAWATPKPKATLLTLDPLAPQQAETLVEKLGLVSTEAKAKIIEAAEGNPLFVEQLVAHQAEEGSGKLEIPPTLQALLATRIDRLEPPERAVIERASVEGRLFHRGSVQALLPEGEREGVGGHLLTLVRKELVRADRSEIPGDDAFRFGHVLIRDAAYQSIPKRRRAELHERFAGWYQAQVGAAAADEILGYHLEQAYLYGAELGAADEELAARAAMHLAAAGERAFARDDMPAAINLLERALALPMAVSTREQVELGLRLSSALLDVGRPTEAEAAARAAAESGAAGDDHAAELRAELFRGQVVMWTSLDYRTLEPLAEGALELFEREGDEKGLMEAWRAIAQARLVRGAHSRATEAFERALDHARRAEAGLDEREILGWFQYNLFNGPVPVQDVLRWREERELEPGASVVAAALLAMDGDIAQAREICARAAAQLRELGHVLWEGALTEFGWEVERLAGNHPEAEEYARRGCRLYEEMHSMSGLGLAGGMLAETLYAQGRYEDAAHWSEVAERSVPDVTGIQMGRWRHVRAKVLARQGDLARAEEFAREAVALTEQTDSLGGQADAWLDLGEVLELAGKHDEAVAATARAAELYEQKGIVPLAERTRARLAELEAQPPASA